MILNFEKGRDYHEVGGSRALSLFIRKPNPNFGKRGHPNMHKPHAFYRGAVNQPRNSQKQAAEPRRVRAWVWLALGALGTVAFANWQEQSVQSAKRLEEFNKARAIVNIQHNYFENEICRVRLGMQNIEPWKLDFNKLAECRDKLEQGIK